ncbi:MAG: cytochrome c [Fimbriimonadaceae bacterium]|nr:cytochrome c [Fimbriimonadaceae bacterium]
MKLALAVLSVAALAGTLLAQPKVATPAPSKDVFSTTACVGCHGVSAMGGLGPPIAKTKLTDEQFMTILRKGRGMMPGTKPDMLSDQDAAILHAQLREMPWDPTQIPLAFKVGSLLTTRNVALFFLFVSLFALVFAVRVLAYWAGNAGLRRLGPKIARFGRGRAAWVFVRSLVVDGLLVASVWRKDRVRWLWHGLILYGFLGLMLADVLMQIFNPTRADVALTHPLKLLPLLSGAAVFTGVLYVYVRYRTDRFIDNGVTLGRDFLFVNLLFHTVLSGFLTMWLNQGGAAGWIMPIYIYHLTSVGLLIATSPFTRFNHAFVAPFLAACTALTEAIVQDEKDLGFLREPSPGRDHKSQRIAEGLLRTIDRDSPDAIRIRYYP